MRREKGFTLVEVVAALVIITIILLSFYPLLISAKRISTVNVDKLVMIQLAEATLNRLKLDPYSYIEKTEVKPLYLYKAPTAKTVKYTYTTCTDNECRDAFQLKMNSRTYHVEVSASQSAIEAPSKLINIIVTIFDEAKKKKYSVEGYITYD